MSEVRIGKRAWSRVTTALLSALVVTYGCGSEQAPPPAASWIDNRFFAPGTACTTDGAKIDCHAVISAHDGIVNCLNGTQTCQDGAWTPCQGDPEAGGSISTRVIGAGGLGPQALSAAKGAGTPPCSSDPCNPYCNGWNETPPTPIAPACAGSTSSTYAMPSAPSIPTGNQNDNRNDCNTGSNNQGCWWGAQCCAKPSGVTSVKVVFELASSGESARAS